MPVTLLQTLLNKIIVGFFTDDMTTTTGATISGTQFPARFGGGHLTGCVAVAAPEFGANKRAVRITDTFRRAVIGTRTGIKGIAFFVRDIGGAGGRNSKPAGVDIASFGSTFSVFEHRATDAQRGYRWWRHSKTLVRGYKNDGRVNPGAFTRHVMVPEFHYASLVDNPAGETLDSIGWEYDALNADAGAFLFFNAQPTDAEWANLIAYARDLGYAIPTGRRPKIIGRGDSILAGQKPGTTFIGSDPISRLTNMIGSEQWDVMNLAQSGMTAADIVTDIPIQEAVWSPNEPDPQKWVVVAIGTNPLGSYATGANAGIGTTVLGEVVSICNQERALGHKIILCTIFPRGDATLHASVTPAMFAASRTTLNNGIISNNHASATGSGGQIAEIICNVGNLAYFTNPSNTAVYDDTLHLTAAADLVFAGELYSTNLWKATTFTITGPIGGSLNAQSGDMWLAPNGATALVTLSSPSGGVTFSPATLDFTADLLPKSFRITPTTGGAKQITASGTGLTAPAAHIYTVADVTAPVVQSAAINAAGNLLTLIFVESESPPMLPASAITGFALSGGHALSGGVRTAPLTMTFNVSGVVYGSETVTLSYSGGNVTDSVMPANALAAIPNAPVVNGSTQVPPAVSAVVVTPEVATVPGGSTEQFAVAVSAVGGASPSVTWGKQSGAGAISSTGLYTAPSGIVGTAQTAVIRATSIFDATKFDEATVTIPGIGGGAATICHVVMAGDFPQASSLTPIRLTAGDTAGGIGIGITDDNGTPVLFTGAETLTFNLRAAGGTVSVIDNTAASFFARERDGTRLVWFAFSVATPVPAAGDYEATFVIGGVTYPLGRKQPVRIQEQI